MGRKFIPNGDHDFAVMADNFARRIAAEPARFDAAGGGERYLRAVSRYGGRYGPPKPPATDFDVVLCDAEEAVRGGRAGPMGWVRLEVPPTRVPKDFAVSFVFRPTASSGVFVGSDESTTGHSFTSVPGKPPAPPAKGDWMIRAELDRPKESDALK